MNRKQYKSWTGVWRPFGLWRIDWYYIYFYLKAFVLILVALAALVAIGDMFQRFGDFVILSQRENQGFQEGLLTFLRYYGSFIPQLLLQYMLPVSMLLAASITATSAFSGPRGNNEYIVIRSAGIPVLRAFFPLLLPALLIALLFQGTRDTFLPGMVRESSAIFNRLKSRVSVPTSVTHYAAAGIQTAAIGWFAPDGIAHNLILEVRDPEKFHRGDASRGDNDFTAFRAAAARLERGPDGTYRWVPLEKAQEHTYGRYARKSVPWTEPVATGMTPAMIERETLGDSVSSWRDLLLMRTDNASARFEMHWRLAEPVACFLLVLLGTGLCMGRMLRGKGASYIQAVALSMLTAALFYALRLAGKTLWESGHISPPAAVWLPILAAAAVTVPVTVWMER